MRRVDGEFPRRCAAEESRVRIRAILVLCRDPVNAEAATQTNSACLEKAGAIERATGFEPVTFCLGIIHGWGKLDVFGAFDQESAVLIDQICGSDWVALPNFPYAHEQ